MTPAVTIVVPVFRTEERLAACLASLLRQSFEDFEVVVVDDCSPGDSASIVAEFARDDDRLRFIRHETNRGVMHARFTGARTSTAEYLSFVDSDDEVEEVYLEVLHAAATRHQADLVQCAYTVRDPDDRVVNRGGDTHELLGGDILRGFLDGEMNNSLWNKLIRTSTWNAATGSLARSADRVPYGEDLLCLLLVAMHSARYVHIPDVGYRYLPGEPNASTAAELDRLVRRLEGLDYTYLAIRTELTDRDLPASSLEAFFEREFLAVTQVMLRDIAALETSGPDGFPRSPAAFGLMGAVARVTLEEWAEHQRWEAEAKHLQSQVIELKTWIDDRTTVIEELKSWIDDRETVIEELKSWIEQLQAAKDFHEQQHLLYRERLESAGA